MTYKTVTFSDNSESGSGIDPIAGWTWTIDGLQVSTASSFPYHLSPGPQRTVTMTATTLGGAHLPPVSGSVVVNPAVPTLAGAAPAAIYDGPSDQSIVFTGTGFEQSLTMSVGLPGGSTSTLSGTQLQVSPPSSIAALVTFGSPGTYTFTVINPDGGISGPFAVTVNSPLFPTLASVPNTGSAPEGQQDVNYGLLSGPTCPAGNCSVLSQPSAGNNGTSKWIRPVGGTPSADPSGQYVYRLSFSVTDAESQTAIITGRWATDDTGIDILINGISTGNHTSQIGIYSTFIVARGFKSGINTLDFVVVNQDCGLCTINPVALRVELAGRAASTVNLPDLLNLPNTGAAGPGLLDPYYAVVSGPTCPTGVCQAVISGGDATSRLIVPTSDSTHPGGQYIYRLGFVVSETEAPLAQINGRWAVDDAGTDILINGVSTGLHTGQSSVFSTLSISSGFRPGVNTLDFVTQNQDCGACVGNPTSLRVELAGSVRTQAQTAVVIDNFDDNAIDGAIWTRSTVGTGPSIAEVNNRLEIQFPPNSTEDPAQHVFWAGYSSMCQLRGDFDLQVDYRLLVWPFANGVRVALATGLGTTLRTSLGSSADFPGQPRETYITDFGGGVISIVPASDVVGMLRQVRIGNTVTGYYYSGGGWVAIGSAQASTADVSFELAAWSHGYAFTGTAVQVAFDNVTLNSGTLACPAAPSLPIANSDAYSMSQGGTLTVPAPGVLANDTIPHGFQSVEFLPPFPTGDLTNLGGGGFKLDLISNPTFTGTLTLRYVIHTSSGDSNVATVTINVAPAGPVVTEIVPPAIMAGPSDRNVLFLGTGFQQGLTMAVGLPGGATSTLSGTQIQIVGPSSISALVTFGSPGTYTFTVKNPDGGVSTAFGITVVASTAAWPMPGHDAQRTNLSPFVGPNSLASPLIIGPSGVPGAGYSYSAPPIISSTGVLYVVYNAESLYALDSNGVLLPGWPFFPESGNAICLSSPTLATDGTIYLPCGHALYALNPDGTKKWATPFSTGNQTGDLLFYTPPTVSALGTVYVVNLNGILTAVNPDGTPQWSLPGFNAYVPPTLGADGTIFAPGGPSVGFSVGGFTALNPDGTIKWASGFGGALLSPTGFGPPVVAADGTVYVVFYHTEFGFTDPQLVGIDPANGNIRYQRPLTTRAGIMLGLSPIGSILNLSNDSALIAYSPDLNAVLFNYSFAPNQSTTGFTTDANGTVYIPAGESSTIPGTKIIAISSTGLLVAEYQTLELRISPPSIGRDGTLYFASGGSPFLAGKIYTFVTTPTN